MADNVSTNFFTMMGIRLVAGRTFGDADATSPRRVVILNESLARALVPDGNILDRRLRFQTGRATQDLLVIGVVDNFTQGDLKNVNTNMLFLPLLTFTSPNMMLEISGDPAPIADAVRRTVPAHGNEFVYDVAMLDDVFARGPARERMSALLSAMIGLLAIALAAIGIHGVLAYSVSRRRREIGVRVAIGAHPSSVVRAIVREGWVLTLIGVAIGLPMAYFAAGTLRSLLFGISETDSLTFVAVAAFFLLLGAVAGLLPARCAAAIDPVVVLRSE
jgi:putative ABC transport system permease protein